MTVTLFSPPHLQRYAVTRSAGECGQSLDGAARHQRLVAAVHLGHSLLDQRHPQLTVLRLRHGPRGESERSRRGQNHATRQRGITHREQVRIT